MLALILDTSTDHLYLGLMHQGTLISWHTIAHEEKPSHFLLSSIETLLHTHAISCRDLTHIACGTGPGSLTGTRVGAIVAMSLSYALDIPSLGFPSSLIHENSTILASFLLETIEKKSYALEIMYK